MSSRQSETVSDYVCNVARRLPVFNLHKRRNFNATGTTASFVGANALAFG